MNITKSNKFGQKLCLYGAAILVAIASLECSTTIFAANITSEESSSTETTRTSNDLFSLLDNITTMSADFVQTVAQQPRSHNKGSQTTPSQQTTGKMSLSRPGKFRWEIEQPTQQLIIATNRYIWIYDIDLEQVTKQSINTRQSGNPAQLLSDSGNALRRTFSVTRLPDEGIDQDSDDATNKPGKHSDYFELRPKAKNSMYNWIRVLFIDSKLRQMTMEDALGQRNKFIFSNVTTNQEISPSLFIFTAPNGVDVIDNTTRGGTRNQ